MSTISAALLTIFIIFTGITYYFHRARSRGRLSYPPTPPGHWLLGNLIDTQKVKLREWFTQLAKQYGDIYHLEILGQHIIMINSLEVANDLLVKRPNIYSDRPQIPMVKLMGWDIAASFLPYGDRWRAHRRLFQQGFNPSTSRSYQSIQLEKVQRFLVNLLEDPDNFLAHTESAIGSTIVKVVYAHDMKNNEKDPVVAAIAEATLRLSEGVTPGRWLVNTFPVLRFIPEWMPGAAFHDFARETRKLVDRTMNAGDEMAGQTGEENSHCLASMLEDSEATKSLSDLSFHRTIAREVCATAYGAGVETTKTALAAFFFAMRQHPEVQHKAYAELSAVVGPDRLPQFTDRPFLPYVEAVYLEAMRWMPAVPFGVPHSNTVDDVYRGYFIPKGSTIFANIWAMCNDENVYQNPRSFKPERFLTVDGNIREDCREILTFGFGRRACVGRHFADASVWLIIASVLATFIVEKPIDDDVDELDQVFTNGLAALVRPFRCSIRPRTRENGDMIRASSVEYAA